jgi:ubiquinone/menaquinone biosynthesis C-methylase UbiE
MSKSNRISIFDYPLIYNVTQFLLEGNFYSKLKTPLKKYLTGTVLDICCGTGDLYRIVSGKYVGLDLNKKSLIYAKKKYPKAKFVHMDATKTNFKASSFDTVFLIDCIHHFNKRTLNKVLSEAKRVSKKYVIIIDMIPVKNPISKLIYSLDQGANIITLKQQVEILSKKFTIVEKKSFFSPRRLYKHSLIICSIK